MTRSYDEWKTTEPDDEPSYGHGGYKCLDCDWVGSGASAYTHHQQQHHRIAYKVKPEIVLKFSCCDKTGGQ